MLSRLDKVLVSVGAVLTTTLLLASAIEKNTKVFVIYDCSCVVKVMTGLHCVVATQLHWAAALQSSPQRKRAWPGHARSGLVRLGSVQFVGV